MKYLFQILITSHNAFVQYILKPTLLPPPLRPLPPRHTLLQLSSNVYSKKKMRSFSIFFFFTKNFCDKDQKKTNDKNYCRKDHGRYYFGNKYLRITANVYTRDISLRVNKNLEILCAATLAKSRQKQFYYQFNKFH